MSPAAHPRPAAGAAGATGATGGATVLVCRGCCCGTDKHADVDHAGHLDALRAAVSSAGGRLWVVDCLDSCDRSNVVVVRHAGQRRWFGDVLDDDVVADLSRWLGAEASAPPPSRLAAHEFAPGEPRPAPTHPSPLHGPALVDWVVDALRAGGSWALGAPGVLAMFDATGAVITTSLTPASSAGTATATATTVTATGSTGSMTLVIDEHVHAVDIERVDLPGTGFATLLVTDAPAEPPRLGWRGPDGVLHDVELATDALVDPTTAVPDGADVVVTTPLGRLEVRAAAVPACVRIDRGDLELGLVLPRGIVAPPRTSPGALRITPAVR